MTSSQKKQLQRALPVSIALVLLSTPIALHANEADSFYQQGVSALRTGDAQQAAKHFIAAKESGVASASLDYNLGVALYKTGDYSQAKSAFINAESNSDNKDLIHYNLGLVEYRLGNKDTAKEWFTKVALNSNDENLNAMAVESVKRIDGAEPTKTKKGNSPWTAIADLYLGYDDNLSLENTELAQASNLSDTYYDAFVAAKYQLTGNTQNGYWIKGGISTTRYQQYGNYDYTQKFVDLSKDAKYSNIQTRLGIKYAQASIGGNDYMQKIALRAQGSYAPTKNHKLTARYELAQYDEESASYAHLAGTRHRVRLDSRWQLSNSRVRVGVELENNDRNDLSKGANFTSYSSTRQKLFADTTITLTQQWKAQLGIDYRITKYSDANIAAAVTSPIREDNRLRLTLAAHYQLTGNIDLVGEYQLTDNDSNIVAEQYQRNQYRVGVQGYF